MPDSEDHNSDSKNTDRKNIDNALSPLFLQHLNITPLTIAEHIALEALFKGTSIWLNEHLPGSNHYENSTIRSNFCNQILLPVFQKRQENQDVTSLYEWTNQGGPFTPRELSLIEKTISLDKSISFAKQMRPQTENSNTEIRAEFLTQMALIKHLSVNQEKEETPFKEILISGALITGQLNLSHCQNCRPLNLTYCQFDETLILNHAKLTSLNLSGSSCPGLKATSASIQGETNLTNGFLAKGPVEIQSSILGGPFNATNGEFHSSGETITDNALSLKLSHMHNEIILSNGFKAEGIIDLHGIHCELDLNCQGATITNQQNGQSGYALICNNANIKGNMDLGENFTALGAISVCNTTIQGKFHANKATINHITSPQISNTLFIKNSHISGNCDFSSITISNVTNTENSAALSFSQCKIDGSLLLNDANLKGMVTITDTTINQSLDFTSATLDNISVKNVGTALKLENTNISYNLNLTNGFISKGKISLVHIKVGQNLICNGGHFLNQVTLSESEIQGLLSLDNQKDPTSKFEDALYLINTKTRTLADNVSTWPNKLIQKNFTYIEFSKSSKTNAQARLNWLKKQGHFSNNAYSQTIKVLSHMGFKGEARTIAISKANQNYWQTLKQITINSQSNDRTRKQPSIFQKLLYLCLWPFFAVFWLIIGGWAAFGYKYSRLFLTSLFVFLFCATIYQKAKDQNLLIPKSPVIALSQNYTNCTPKTSGAWAECNIIELPTFSPSFYSLDTMIPFLDLGQQTNWRFIEKQVSIHLPSPTCFQPIKACLNIKWLPIKIETNSLTKIVMAQITYGWFLLISIILYFTNKNKRKFDI